MGVGLTPGAMSEVNDQPAGSLSPEFLARSFVILWLGVMQRSG